MSVKNEKGISDEPCCICLENIKAKDTITTRCNHLFHSNCITGWQKQSRVQNTYSCPSCRAELDMPEALRGRILPELSLDEQLLERADELLASLDELRARRDELLARRDELLARGDELLARRDELQMRLNEGQNEAQTAARKFRFASACILGVAAVAAMVFLKMRTL